MAYKTEVNKQSTKDIDDINKVYECENYHISNSEKEKIKEFTVK